MLAEELVPEVRYFIETVTKMQLQLVKGAMNWSSRPLFCDLRAQDLALGVLVCSSFSLVFPVPRTGWTWGPFGPSDL